MNQLTHETWKLIPDCIGSYEVSDHGRVRNSKSGLILKPRPTPHGYLRVHLHRKDRYIHRLVAEAFCKHPDGADVVNHIDNDPTNNLASNLEWVTQRDNVIYAMDQKRVQCFPNAHIIVGVKDGIEHRFRSYHEAAEYVKHDHKTVMSRCKKGVIDSDGYTWKVVKTA